MEWIDVFEEVKKTLGMSVTDIARQMDERVDRLHQFKSRGVKPNYEFLRKFLITFPQLSADFVMKGEGEVLKVDVQPVEDAVDTDSKKDVIIEALTEQVRNYKKRVEELESAHVN